MDNSKSCCNFTPILIILLVISRCSCARPLVNEGILASESSSASIRSRSSSSEPIIGANSKVKNGDLNLILNRLPKGKVPASAPGKRTHINNNQGLFIHSFLYLLLSCVTFSFLFGNISIPIVNIVVGKRINQDLVILIMLLSRPQIKYIYQEKNIYYYICLFVLMNVLIFIILVFVIKLFIQMSLLAS